MTAARDWPRCLAILGALSLGVCAASSVRALDANDQRVESFTPASGKAVVYVYRPAQRWGRDVTFWLSIDGRHIGNIPNGKFFRVEVDPGDHDVWVRGLLYKLLPIAAVAGQAYFVRAGFHAHHDLILPVKDQQELLACCAMAESARSRAVLFN